MKTILSVITLALATSVAFAADFDDALNYETITLKSGDKVSGYIVSQNNSEFFTFKPVEQYVEADTCIADTAIVEVVPIDMAVADSTVVECDSVAEVIVVEPVDFALVDSVEVIEAFDNPSEIRLNWDDVSYIERNTSLGGILDVIVLGDNTEYVGYIIRNNPVSGIRFKTLDNKVHMLKWDDIVIYSRRPLDPEKSILSQSPLISTYTFAGLKPLEGLIVEQEYETGLITIETADGSVQRNSARITNITNRPNENLYTPKRKAPKRRAVY